MKYLITFLIAFVVIYLIYYIIVVNRKAGINKFKNGKQVEYFKTVYKLDFKKVNLKKFANDIALANSFIMSVTFTVLELVDGLILKMVVGFVVIIIMMLIVYKMVGDKYRKKEG